MHLNFLVGTLQKTKAPPRHTLRDSHAR